MIAIVGDIQIDAPERYNYRNRNYVLDASLETLKYIFQYEKDKNVSAFIFLGDVFERSDKLPNRIKNPTIELFRSVNIPIYILVGNHDFDGTDLSLKFLESDTIHLISQPTDLVINGANFFCVPYYKDMSKIIENLSNRDRHNKYDALLGHFELEGSSYGGIKESTSGIPLRYLKGFKKVFCGHIHKYKKFKNGVYNVGSTYQTNWGEVGEDKFFFLFSKDKLIKVPIPKFVYRKDFYVDSNIDIKSIMKEPTPPKEMFLFARITHSSKVDIQLLNKLCVHLKRVGFDSVELDDILELPESILETEKEVRGSKGLLEKHIKKVLKSIKNPGLKYFHKKVIEEVLDEN